MNRDKFREIFDEGYLMPPYSSYGLFMFNQCRNNGYKYYCFTEGSTDDVFYKNVLYICGIDKIRNMILISFLCKIVKKPHQSLILVNLEL